MEIEDHSPNTPVDYGSVISAFLMVLGVLIIIAGYVLFSAWQGSSGQVDIPITGQPTDSVANVATSGLLEPFAKPEVLGLLAAVTGTLIFGLSVTVLARLRQ